MRTLRAALILLVAVSAPVLAGCPNGPKSVQFGSDGTAHCPYCAQAVPPHSDQCSNCGLHYKWAGDTVICWYCKGTTDCPACRGMGKVRNSSCGICKGTGQCPECEKGLVRYGTAALR